MKCHVCGSTMSSMITDLPFKLTEASIVILKGVPVLQCDGCREYLLVLRPRSSDMFSGNLIFYAAFRVFCLR